MRILKFTENEFLMIKESIEKNKKEYLPGSTKHKFCANILHKINRK